MKRSFTFRYFYLLSLLPFFLNYACAYLSPSTIKMPDINSYEETFQKGHMNRFIKEFDNPQSLSDYMASKIPCVPDRIQHSQPPLETFLRGAGDCEDQAVFAAYSLNQMGYHAWTFLIKWKGWNVADNAHAVAVYFEGNDIYLLDNCLRLGVVGPVASFQDVSALLQKKANRSLSWYRLYSWEEFLKAVP